MSSAPNTAPAGTLPADPPVAERFFRVSVFCLVLTSVGTLVATGKLDKLAVLLVPAAILYKGFRVWRGHKPELSHAAATGLVAAYLLVFPVDFLFFSRVYATGSTNPAVFATLLASIHFLLFVLLVRLYSASTDRDALFLALLSFAAILAGAVLTVDTYFLALFFVFLGFGVATFIGYEVRRAARGAVTSLLAARPEFERKFHRALGLAAGSVALGATVIGMLLFFFFPRFTAGYLGRIGSQPSLMSGFSDDVELGQIGEIKKNSAVIMRVKTTLPAAAAQIRWRGIALSTFDGRRWYTTGKRERVLAMDPEGWFEIPEIPESLRFHSIPMRYTILLQPVATDALFAPAYVLSLRGNFASDPLTPDGGARRSYLRLDSTRSLFNPFHNYVAFQYEGFSLLPNLAPKLLREAPAEYPQETRATYLQLPPLDPRVEQLARQITANAATPYDKATAIEIYLRTRFGYTLDLTGKPEEDALARFLFVTRSGHCEYFASAMTVMLRTLGVPARVVNGFLPGQYNDIGGDYIVRASDAHTWVEVYFPGYGWLTFDPTPPGRDAEGLLSRVGAYWDWLQLTWNEWIVNYDFAHQFFLAQSMHRASRTWSSRARVFFEGAERRGKDWILSWNSGRLALRALLPVAIVLFLLALNFDKVRRAFRRLRIEWRARSGREPRPDTQLASLLYEELLRLLTRRGFRHRESQTPLEFAAAVSSPALAPALGEFTLLYAQARFGGAPCDAPRLQDLLQQIRQALRGH